MAGGVPVASAPTASTSEPGKSYLVPLVALTSLFFMWGFITCLNDILIPHLKAIFKLSYFQASFIQSAFFIAYAIMSIPSGGITKRLGYKRSIVIGLSTMATGCLLFYPAAGQRSYPVFLVALFVLACGITLLQVAANPFVAILGSPKTASSRLTMTQAFNALGTTIAPQFGALLILSTAVKSSADLAHLTPAELDAYHVAEAGSVQTPYIGLAVTLIVLAILFALFKLPTITAGSSDGTGADAKDDRASAWKYRRLVFGALAIFAYVGAEVAIGSFLVNFLALPKIAGYTEAEAARYVSIYWGGAMVGRFLGTVTLRRFDASRVLVLHAAAAAALVLAAMLLSGSPAMWAILAVGFFNSIMFPTIFTLAIDGLGRHTSQGSGILCTAIVGGGLVMNVYGKLADSIGLQYAYVIPIACYAYIGWYGLRWSKLQR